MNVNVLKNMIVFFVLSNNLRAEVPAYQITENTGLNKQERIDYLDKYMANLSSTLKSFESKLDENSKKMKDIEASIKEMKVEADKKNVSPQTNEKKQNKNSETSEVEKLKADILVLKNKDIEKIKSDLSDLSDEVKLLLKTVKEH